MIGASQKVSAKDALALLSLRSAPTSPSRLQAVEDCWTDDQKGQAIAKFEGRGFEYVMRLPQKNVTVGRSSSKGQVDIDMEPSSFVSRCHFHVFFSPNADNKFFISCAGKNGIFVDGVFQRKGGAPMELPNKCTFRFPSTTIRINFQSLIVDELDDKLQCSNNTTPNTPLLSPPPSFVTVTTSSSSFVVTSSHTTVTIATTGTTTVVAMHHSRNNKFLTPLNINIPKFAGFTSPCPSPTGTISAANSCPTSPRTGSRFSLNFDLRNVNDLSMTSSSAVTSVDDDAMMSDEVEDVGDGRSPVKPPYSYAQLIVQAISSQEDRQLTLSGIYAYISKNYPYYRPSDKGWQNSIRHNLSLNRFFMKVPRSQEEPGKGSFWKIEPSSENKLIEQAFRRRRQRVGMSFNNTNDQSSRSAPASPNQSNDNSMSDGMNTHQSLVSAEVQSNQSKPLHTQLIGSQIIKLPQGLNISQKCIQLSNDQIHQLTGSHLDQPRFVVATCTGSIMNSSNPTAQHSATTNNDANDPNKSIFLFNQSQTAPRFKSDAVLPVAILQQLSQSFQQQQQQQQKQLQQQQQQPQQDVQHNNVQQLLLQKLLQQGTMVINKSSNEIQQQSKNNNSSNNLDQTLNMQQQQQQQQQQIPQLQGGTLYTLPTASLQVLLGTSIAPQQQQQLQQLQQQLQHQIILLPSIQTTNKVDTEQMGSKVQNPDTKQQLFMTLPQMQQQQQHLLQNIQQQMLFNQHLQQRCSHDNDSSASSAIVGTMMENDIKEEEDVTSPHMKFDLSKVIMEQYEGSMKTGGDEGSETTTNQIKQEELQHYSQRLKQKFLNKQQQLTDQSSADSLHEPQQQELKSQQSLLQEQQIQQQQQQQQLHEQLNQQEQQHQHYLPQQHLQEQQYLQQQQHFQQQYVLQQQQLLSQHVSETGNKRKSFDSVNLNRKEDDVSFDVKKQRTASS